MLCSRRDQLHPHRITSARSVVLLWGTVMKTPPLEVKVEDVSVPAADPAIKATKPAANRNSSRFAQWRQREMHLRFSAHFEAFRKNPLTRLWNRNSLAAELGCKPKTIGKDIATMKDSLGYPLEFYPEKHDTDESGVG